RAALGVREHLVGGRDRVGSDIAVAVAVELLRQLRRRVQERDGRAAREREVERGVDGGVGRGRAVHRHQDPLQVHVHLLGRKSLSRTGTGSYAVAPGGVASDALGVSRAAAPACGPYHPVAVAGPALLLDLYELTMAQAYVEAGVDEHEATFSVFVRRLPPGWGSFLAAGLDDALSYLEMLAFGEDDLAFLETTGLFRPALLERLRGLRFGGAVR